MPTSGQQGFRVRLSAMAQATQRLAAEARETTALRGEVAGVGTTQPAVIGPDTFGRVPNSARVALALNVCVEAVCSTLDHTAAEVEATADAVRTARDAYAHLDTGAGVPVQHATKGDPPPGVPPLI